MTSSAFGALWAEDIDLSDLQFALPALARHGLAVHLAWHAGSDDADRLALAAEAATYGVPVRPWLLLPPEEGYWAGAENAAVFADTARRLFDRWCGAGLAPGLWVVDMEPPRHRVEALDAALKDGIRRWPAMWRQLRDEASVDLSTPARVYADLVDEATRLGFSTWLTTLPMVADDFAAGTDTYQRWLGLPVNGSPWSVVSLQVYRTMFDDSLPWGLKQMGVGPGIVARYGRLVRAAFGDRGGLDLGLVGGGVIEDSGRYSAPKDLGADLAAAHGVGVPANQISVFSLEGVLERGPVEGWLAPPTHRPVKAGIRAALQGKLMTTLARLGR
ncbi:MAG: hypothetical protein ACE366_07675 [Bradymonadia bacterium]